MLKKEEKKEKSEVTSQKTLNKCGLAAFSQHLAVVEKQFKNVRLRLQMLPRWSHLQRCLNILVWLAFKWKFVFKNGFLPYLYKKFLYRMNKAKKQSAPHYCLNLILSGLSYELTGPSELTHVCKSIPELMPTSQDHRFGESNVSFIVSQMK